MSLVLQTSVRAPATSLLLPCTRTLEAAPRKGWLTPTILSWLRSSLARKVAPRVNMNFLHDSKSSLSSLACSF